MLVFFENRKEKKISRKQNTLHLITKQNSCVTLTDITLKYSPFSREKSRCFRSGGKSWYTIIRNIRPPVARLFSTEFWVSMHTYNHISNQVILRPPMCLTRKLCTITRYCLSQWCLVESWLSLIRILLCSLEYHTS